MIPLTQAQLDNATPWMREAVYHLCRTWDALRKVEEAIGDDFTIETDAIQGLAGDCNEANEAWQVTDADIVAVLHESSRPGVSKTDALIADAIKARASQYGLESGIHEALLDLRLLCDVNGLDFFQIETDSYQSYLESKAGVTQERLEADYKLELRGERANAAFNLTHMLWEAEDYEEETQPERAEWYPAPGGQCCARPSADAEPCGEPTVVRRGVFAYCQGHAKLQGWKGAF